MMETKVVTGALLVFAVLLAAEARAATTHQFSTHGSAAAASLVHPRLRTRQTPGAATASLPIQQTALYAFRQQQQQLANGQDPSGGPYPTGNLIFYPAHGSNPLVAQNQQQFRLQNLQGAQPLAQQYLQQQLYTPQQSYSQQQQQQQPELQYQQQDPIQTLGPIPGGVRYVLTPGTSQPAQLLQRRPAPQVAEASPAPQAAEPAAPTRGAQLGVSYSPATAVSTIKFSNPYANYSYG